MVETCRAELLGYSPFKTKYCVLPRMFFKTVFFEGTERIPFHWQIKIHPPFLAKHLPREGKRWSFLDWLLQTPWHSWYQWYVAPSLSPLLVRETVEGTVPERWGTNSALHWQTSKQLGCLPSKMVIIKNKLLFGRQLFFDLSAFRLPSRKNPCQDYNRLTRLCDYSPWFLV